MTDWRSVSPLLTSFVVSIFVFAALSWVADGAESARFRQDVGLTRGPILDRNGLLLAHTVNNGNRAQRRYALDDLAAAVGYQDPAGKWHGLEQTYNAFLTGQTARRDWRTFFLNLRGQPVQGGRLRLTLDSTLQRVADQALGKARGAVVALDPRTGAVLALVSKPNCSPAQLSAPTAYQTCSADPAQPLLDRATSLLVPPGSSFKIVTLTAAMDTRRFSLTQIFTGADVFGPSPYFDNSMYPSNITRSDITQLTLLQALAFSDNFTFAHIGLTLGAPTLLKYARRYYIGRQIPFDYPVSVSHIANGDAHPSLSVLAQSAFGAAVDQVTPLQMALIASTVANKGVMMAPHLVQDLETPKGKVIYRYPVHPLGRVMSAQAASNVTTAMDFVVNHGSGYKAQLSGVQAAGKTGTADSGADKPHAWFIAFAPAQHPMIAVAVLHEYSGEGFQYAAPIARKVLIAALREDGYRVRPGPMVP